MAAFCRSTFTVFASTVVTGDVRTSETRKFANVGAAVKVLLSLVHRVTTFFSETSPQNASFARCHMPQTLHLIPQALRVIACAGWRDTRMRAL